MRRDLPSGVEAEKEIDKPRILIERNPSRLRICATNRLRDLLNSTVEFRASIDPKINVKK
jgi:hypothetical protein